MKQKNISIIIMQEKQVAKKTIKSVACFPHFIPEQSQAWKSFPPYAYSLIKHKSTKYNIKWQTSYQVQTTAVLEYKTLSQQVLKRSVLPVKQEENKSSTLSLSVSSQAEVLECHLQSSHKSQSSCVLPTVPVSRKLFKCSFLKSFQAQVGPIKYASMCSI